MLEFESFGFSASELTNIALAPDLLFAMSSLQMSMEEFVVDGMARSFNSVGSSFILG